MKLYELDASIQALIDSLPDGELDTENEAKLDALVMQKEAKCLSIAAVCKSMKYEHDAIAEEEKKLRERRTAIDNRREWLRGYLARHLEPGEKMKDARCMISWRTTTAVDVAEGTVLPDDCVRVIIEPNKTILKQRLEAGEEIEGVALVARTSIQIR